MIDLRFWQHWPDTLRWAVGASLLFHLLVLLPVGLLVSPVAIPPAPFAVVLKGPGEVAQAAPESASRAKPMSAGDSTKRIAPVAKPLAAQRPDSAAQSVAKPAPQTVGTTTGDTSAPANTAARAGTTGGAPDAARNGIEADALTRYKLALGIEARKAKRYPDVSRMRGQEGTCEIFVVLTRGGTTPGVVPGKSSGSEMLDEEALRTVRVAAAHTPVPTELQSRDERIPLAIQFRLNGG